MNGYDQQLKELLAQCARKRKLEASAAELRRQRDTYAARAEELKEAMREEQADVDRLEGRSLAAFFYNVVGKMDEKLTQERQEAYAARVRRDPTASVVGVGAGKLHVSAAEPVPLTGKRKGILVIFALTFLVMIYGVIPFDEMGLPLPAAGWWFPELSALFLVSGVVIGLVDRMSEQELTETFVAGCADLLGVAFIIGISRGITVVMNGAHVTDTILHWGEEALSGAGSAAFTLMVFALYLPLSILIPSSSGLATLSIPILAPLGKFAGVGGDLVVTAFQAASGLVNIITPTAAVVMGALALGHVGYDRWFRYVWKLIVCFFLLTVVFLLLGVWLS